MGNEITKKLLLHKATQALIMNGPDGYSAELSTALPETVMGIPTHPNPT